MERLQAIPFLYLFFALSCFGVIVDLRLRVSKAIALPHLPWVLTFYAWALLTVVINAPHEIIASSLTLTITVLLFVLVAQGVQSFRMFQTVALWLGLTALALSFIGVDQGLSPTTCIKIPSSVYVGGEILGVPDGRPCDNSNVCYLGDREPGADYWCEKPGLFGTHSVGGRVRYRGVLMDPNELSLAIGAGLAFVFAICFVKPTLWRKLFLGVSLTFAGWCVYFSGSRSGQLVLVAVLGVFILWRYRWKAILTLGPLAIPLLLAIASGGGRKDADASTMDRYEAWASGFEMVRSSPIWGVGAGQYAQHHRLTAHNTYVLVMAETGFVGLFVFAMLIFVALKTCWLGMNRYRGRPEARAAEVWGVALLASFAAIFAGATFLSFAYHYILWIYLGLTAAYYSCVKRHDPDFEVHITFGDMVIVFLVALAIAPVLRVYLRLQGF